MTLKTRAAIKVDNANALPDNNSGIITPSVLRGVFNDVVDSALFAADVQPDLGNGVTAYSWGNHAVAGYKTSVSQADVTQHQSALQIVESQITDLKNYLTSVSQTDVTQHQAALQIVESQITDLKNYLTSVSQADVTQHQSALQIAESQITDLQDYVVSDPDTITYPNSTPIPQMFFMPQADYDSLSEEKKSAPYLIVVV
jgi:uncharacterized cysteine cluster protein YcgN (CxxCxxCC family)